MSLIYFHSEHETAEVSGRERAGMGVFCGRQLLLSMGLDECFLSSQEAARYRRLLPADHYTQTGTDEQFLYALRSWLCVGSGAFGITRKTDTFTAALNTALAVGGDVVRLIARLHGQCEVHAYVEGRHRAWLADIIERGRTANILRPNMGWEGVCEMLRRRDDAAVVTSYSVCQSFPNPTVAQWQDDQEGDGFYALTTAQRWALALTGLRQSGGGLEMSPDNWQTFYFGNGLSGFDIANDLTMIEGAAHA